MKKFFISLAVAFVLSVPAFAVDYFASPLEVTRYNAGQVWYSFTLSERDSSKPVYFYLREINANNVYYGAISESQNAPFQVSGSNNSYSCYTQFGNYWNYETGAIEPSATSEPIVAKFPSTATDADIQNAFSAFLNGASVRTFTASISIPRGNVLYFQVPESQHITFTSTMSFDSYVLNTAYSPWGDTGQRISEESGLPTAGTVFPRVGSGSIPWEKSPPYNLFGQTKVGTYTDTFSPGQYYAFYNPNYTLLPDGDGIGSDKVGATVVLSGTFSYARVYPLAQLLDESTSDDGYETWLDAEGDDNGGVIWTDQDNEVSAPESGGQNQESETISSNSLIESIKTILKRILSEIENIFTFGFSAIHDLVRLMDEFVSTFDDLYEWLPDECYTLLIACVSVAIVIGVFKVFL